MCIRDRPRKSARGKSAFSQVQEHLTEVGVNFEGEDESEEIATGFRTIRKNNEN